MLEFNLPFKLSNAVDFSAIFKNYFGIEALFKEFSNFFQECTNFRKELDYALIAQHLPSNQKLYDETEQKIIKFLRYEYILDKNFQFQAGGGKNSLNFSFSWLDSFNVKSCVNLSNMKYEISCHLYNFALNEYFNSIKLMNGVEIQQKKLAIAKFKVGAWALSEIKTFLPIISSNANNVKMPLDFNRNYLTILENLMIGLAYFSFLDIHEINEHEFGILNIATIANEASKSFKIALDLLINDKELPILPEIKKQIHTSLYILYTISFSFTCMKLSIHNEELHTDDQTKGYLGLAISYFKAGAKVVNAFFSQKYDLNNFPSFLRDRLNNQNVYFSKGNTKNETRNAQIYHHKVYQENELPPLADINPQIKLIGAKPSAFDKPFEYDGIFDVITNPEIQKDAENLKNLFEKKKKELDEEIRKLSEKKMKAFVENYVNYLLDKPIVASHSKGLPKTLEDKRKAFLTKGGMTKLSAALANLKENAFNCMMTLEKIKEKLTNEKNEDINMKAAYQNNWSRMKSDQLTPEYFKQINDLTGKIKIAQGVDGSIGSKFQTYSKYGEMISKPPEELLKLVPSQKVAESSNNSDTDILKDIKDNNDSLTKLFENLKGIIISFTEEFAKMNITQEIITAKKSNIPVENIFENFSGKILFNFKNLLNQITKSIDEICSLAILYNSTQKNQANTSSEAKILEEMTSGAVMLCELYDDVDQGMKFYENLSNLLVKLDKNVDDYCCARDIEKNALLQEITQRMGGMNFQGNFNPYH